MNSVSKVLMIITLDTKAAEARYVRGVLEEHGVAVVHLDASIRAIVCAGAEIGPEAVAGEVVPVQKRWRIDRSGWLVADVVLAVVDVAGVAGRGQRIGPVER